MPKLIHRRTLLAVTGAVTILSRSPLATAAGLAATPAQTEGPFYPVAIPGDADSDLRKVAGHGADAKGTPLHLGGRLRDRQGRPVVGGTVEIWQCDHQGHYLHPGDQGPRDQDFQGFGRAVTDAEGGYGFRTIKPVPYPGRTPHIHFAILVGGKRVLVTQMYVAGDPQNARDMIYRGLGKEGQRAVTVELGQVSGYEPGALGGTFDIVLPLG